MGGIGVGWDLGEQAKSSGPVRTSSQAAANTAAIRQLMLERYHFRPHQ